MWADRFPTLAKLLNIQKTLFDKGVLSTLLDIAQTLDVTVPDHTKMEGVSWVYELNRDSEVIGKSYFFFHCRLGDPMGCGPNTFLMIHAATLEEAKEKLKTWCPYRKDKPYEEGKGDLGGDFTSYGWYQPSPKLINELILEPLAGYELYLRTNDAYLEFLEDQK